ncbi:hypothetical protein C3L33_11331, partial [Rhododendron williamsianum]
MKQKRNSENDLRSSVASRKEQVMVEVRKERRMSMVGEEETFSSIKINSAIDTGEEVDDGNVVEDGGAGLASEAYVEMRIILTGSSVLFIGQHELVLEFCILGSLKKLEGAVSKLQLLESLTIDNDILVIDKPFGFDTAFEEAQRAINGAHVESDSIENGIGLVKLMGRYSAFEDSTRKKMEQDRRGSLPIFYARLPQARVIYCSAIGASEPHNLGYMVRLGLWGAATCFSNFHEFLGALEKGGIGALELVAMDMKASRMLSYKGVEFEVVEAPLEAKMMVLLVSAGCGGSVQRDWFEFGVGVSVGGGTWEVHMVEDLVLVVVWGVDRRKEESKTKEEDRVLYEGVMERKLKIPEIICFLDLPNNPLDDIIDQAMFRVYVEDVELGGNSNPPVSTNADVIDVQDDTVVEVGQNTENRLKRKVPPQRLNLKKSLEKDIDLLSGITSTKLKRMRKRLKETIEKRKNEEKETGSEEGNLGHGSLGGPDKVVEITGRQGMLVRASGGKGVTYQGRNTKDVTMEMVNMHEKQHFMDGKKLVAIISEAGSAGLLLNASGTDDDALLVLSPGCSSDKPDTIQEFMIKGKAALVSVGIVRDTSWGNGKDSGKLSGHIVDSDMHDVGRFLNRLLGLPPEIQNRLLELFVSILELLIQNAHVEGYFDSGIVDMKANIIEQQGTPKTVHVDHMSGTLSASVLLEEKQKDGLGSPNDGFFESKREWLGRRHFLLAFEGSASGLYKIVRPAVGEALREMPLAELKNKYRRILELEKARSGWEDEYECIHGPSVRLVASVRLAVDYRR